MKQHPNRHINTEKNKSPVHYHHGVSYYFGYNWPSYSVIALLSLGFFHSLFFLETKSFLFHFRENLDTRYTRKKQPRANKTTWTRWFEPFCMMLLFILLMLFLTPARALVRVICCKKEKKRKGVVHEIVIAKKAQNTLHCWSVTCFHKHKDTDNTYSQQASNCLKWTSTRSLFLISLYIRSKWKALKACGSNCMTLNPGVCFQNSSWPFCF